MARNGQARQIKIGKGGNITTLMNNTAYNPTLMVTDAANNIYFSLNYDLYKMTPAGVITLFAGSGHQEHKDGAAGSASFDGIEGLCMDKAGNIFATDQQGVRKIAPDGSVATIINHATLMAIPVESGQMDNLIFNGMAIDAAENLYFSVGPIIYKATKTGKVSLLAGRNPMGALSSDLINGYAPLAIFSGPEAIAVDASGNNVYVSDPGELHIRKITTTMQ
jgi:sugar lactone lactonase YvrE